MTSKHPGVPRWNGVTALFGGRFDPPHVGHRGAVRGLFDHPRVKQVWVIPSATPPHKKALAASEDRLKMAQLNFQTLPHDSFPAEVSVKDLELVRAQAKPHVPSYSFDTLSELRGELKDLAFVVGTDQLVDLPKWHRFPEILGLCHWIVLERKSVAGDARKVLSEWEGAGLVSPIDSTHWQIKRTQTCLTLVPTDAPPYSSTQIRESIVRDGKPPQDSLLPEVFGYLKDRRLYGI